MKKQFYLLVAATLLVATAATAQPQRRRQLPPELPLKDVHTHDPVMAKEGDTYYLYSTGMGISVMSSKDMKIWKFEKPVFAKNTSVIGHATSPTLNPASPEYKWTDHGKIIQSVPNRDMWNAIDPNVIVDEDGK